MKWLGKELVFLVIQIRLPLFSFLLRHPGEERIRVATVRLGWEAMFYRLFHYHPFGRVEVAFPHILATVLRGWRRSSSRPWPQCPVSRWLARRSLSFKQKI
ncbi:hypothetical protein Hanom_Chr16g01474081 [Helianthus anomalus]